MLRIIIRSQHLGAAAHIPDAKAETDFRTFDVSLPEIEKYLRPDQKWTSREIIGVEILE